jgi:Fe-Mn family superoxide dismutase
MTESSNFEESKRNLLKMGLAAATLGVVGSGVKAATTKPERVWWTTAPIQAKDFSPLVNKPPEGMSSRQISEHLGLYKKYVSSYNKVKEQEKSTGINHDTLINKGFAYGGTVLHELYFDNLGQAQTALNYQSPLMTAIEREYGAFEGLINNFKDAGMAARGWAILGLNLFDGRLTLMGMDAHNEGSALTFVWPIVVMDVYEHAYMIDHGTNKAAYVDGFLKNINWNVAEARFNQAVKNIANSPLVL